MLLRCLNNLNNQQSLAIIAQENLNVNTLLLIKLSFFYNQHFINNHG